MTKFDVYYFQVLKSISSTFPNSYLQHLEICIIEVYKIVTF